MELIIALVFGAITASVATSRGRNGLAWFFIGFFLSCLGLIILLVIPDLKQEQERHKRHSRENRRLREQLKKERAVSDARYEQTERRLGVHDRALGLDTTGKPIPPPQQQTAALPPGFADASWFYMDNEYERQGPISLTELQKLWRSSQVGARTLVWTKSMEDWADLGEVPGLEDALRG